MTRHLNDVHPGLRRAARLLPPGYALKRGHKLQRAAMGFIAKVGADRDAQIVGVSPTASVRVHRPAAAAEPGPALLWMHGGGYVMGGAGQEDRFCRKLAHLTGVTVVSVEYRLAPEFPYPAALHDCHAALMWLAEQRWADPERLGVGGASAGGGLAAALALQVRDRDELRLACQLLAHPMLDDRTGARPDQRRRILWSGSDNQQAWRLYLAGADPKLAAPARRADLSKLAPAWIGIGSLDLFFDECALYSRRLNDAGTPAHLEAVDGAFHTFDMIAPDAAPSLRFFASQCEFLRTQLVG